MRYRRGDFITTSLPWLPKVIKLVRKTNKPRQGCWEVCVPGNLNWEPKHFTVQECWFKKISKTQALIYLL